MKLSSSYLITTWESPGWTPTGNWSETVLWVVPNPQEKIPPNQLWKAQVSRDTAEPLKL